MGKEVKIQEKETSQLNDEEEIIKILLSKNHYGNISKSILAFDVSGIQISSYFQQPEA